MSGHYFDDPTVESRPTDVVLSLPEGAFTLRTDRGVFSNGGVDSATRLLLLDAPAPPATGNLLDLGCGAGPIAIALAVRSPDATVWAVDVNERARALTAHNAEVNGLGNIRVAAPADVPADITFDAIWSNPPIRVGKAALHELLLLWLPRLTPEGAAVMVVGKNLGADSLQAWLTGHGWPTSRLSSARGFRILRTVRA
jgi:16S rRNA G1207 methylase RsmC